MVAAEIVVHDNREQEYLQIQRMSRRMRWRQLLTLIGFKLQAPGDRLDISRKIGRNFTIIFIPSLLIIFDRGEIRLQAQEVSARTKTVHGDKSENISGHRSTMKPYRDWAFTVDQIHHYFFSSGRLLCLTLRRDVQCTKMKDSPEVPLSVDADERAQMMETVNVNDTSSSLWVYSMLLDHVALLRISLSVWQHVASH